MAAIFGEREKIKIKIKIKKIVGAAEKVFVKGLFPVGFVDANENRYASTVLCMTAAARLDWRDIVRIMTSSVHI